MVIDTSALLAILQNEPEGPTFTEALVRAPLRLIAMPTLFETSMVVLSREGEEGLALLRQFLTHAQIETVPFSAEHVEQALDGFRHFGRGRHRAGLNMGDCFAYALAKTTGEPLLFKGDDFAHTDILRAA